MKKILALFTLILFVFAGCLTDSGDDKKDNDDDGTNGNGGSFTVTGRAVLGTVDSSGLSGVKLTFIGIDTNLSVNSDNSGNFSFSKIAEGTYVLTPSKTGYTFSPTNVAVTVTDKNVIVVPFIATQIDNNNNGNAGTSNYTPFKLNATWTYDSVWDIGDYQSNNEYTDAIKATKSFNGKTYWMMVSDHAGEYSSYSDTTYFRVSNNIVYTFIEDMMSGVAKSTNASKITSILKSSKVSSEEVPVLKFGLANGTIWEIYNDSGSYQGDSYSFNMNGKYIGTESVQVTAGSFQNCAKFELTSIMSSTYDNQTYSSTSKVTMWFGSNVGIVKQIEALTSNYGSADETFTYTDTLKSFNIP